MGCFLWLDIDKEVKMADLFETLGSGPGDGNSPAVLSDPAPAAEENQLLATAATEAGDADTVIEEADENVSPVGVHEDGEELSESETVPTSIDITEKKPDQKPINVVEEDPYDFDKCLITVAMALMPDDGNPDGRKVMVGVRNHQDEPLLATCRLGDLAPLPDPIQQLLEQLKEQLPARSEKASERKKKAEEAKKKLASKTKAAAKASSPAQAKKTEKAKPTTINLFDMFDQPSQ